MLAKRMGINGSLCGTNVVVMLDTQYCTGVAKEIGVVGIRGLDGLYLELVASFVAVPRTRSQNLAFYRTANSGERQTFEIDDQLRGAAMCRSSYCGTCADSPRSKGSLLTGGGTKSWRLHVKPKLTRKPGC